jgi:hypothetical protein
MMNLEAFNDGGQRKSYLKSRNTVYIQFKIKLFLNINVK